MVGAGHVVETGVVALRAGDDGGGSAAAPVTLHQAQREQAEVGLVLHVDQARAGLVALGRDLLVGRGLLVAVHAAAQQLLVLRRSVVLTAQTKGQAFSLCMCKRLMEFHKTPEADAACTHCRSR